MALKKLRLGTKASMPDRLAPMLATRTDNVFNDPQYLYEVKWDGYRIISHIKNGRAILYSRALLDYSKKYLPIVEALEELHHDAILDGEIVVLDEDGVPSFDMLQNYSADHHIIYYVFDLLWLDGYNLLKVPLIERKKILSKIIPAKSLIKYNDHFTDGIKLNEEIKSLNLEGIVAKKIQSIYQPGKRTTDWLKVPAEKRQEFVIGGWTESDSGRPFRSLLFGAYGEGKLINIGHAGGGFKDREMPAMLSELRKKEIKKIHSPMKLNRKQKYIG